MGVADALTAPRRVPRSRRRHQPGVRARRASSRPPASADALEILPGVPEALARLRRAGFRLVVVTNQPDVARGTQTREAVEAIHARLGAALPLDEIRVCYHDDAEGACAASRSPALLTQDPPASIWPRASWWAIAGATSKRAGAPAARRCSSNGRRRAAAHEPDVRVASLTEAADWILARPGRQSIDEHR